MDKIVLHVTAEQAELIAMGLYHLAWPSTTQAMQAADCEKTAALWAAVSLELSHKYGLDYQKTLQERVIKFVLEDERDNARLPFDGEPAVLTPDEPDMGIEVKLTGGRGFAGIFANADSGAEIGVSAEPDEPDQGTAHFGRGHAGQLDGN